MQKIIARFALGVVGASSMLFSAAPAFAAGAGADVVVDPGQQVAGSLTKDFTGAPVADVEFTGGDFTAEVTGTIADGTLVWRLCVAPGGDGSVHRPVE